MPAPPTAPTRREFDVLVVGAGLSGIGVAYYLKTAGGKKRSFALLERRPRLGGTWDHFRYPGVRNDSTMHTYAYAFHPWRRAKHIVGGSEILAYLNEVVDAHGLREHIITGQSVARADFDTPSGRWTLATADGAIEYACRYLVLATGYYDYAAPHVPEIPGRQLFGGQVVHPQLWCEAGDGAGPAVEGKRVVLVGSGATAVTMLPALAASAAHVTLLQRSPGYVLPVPSTDGERCQRAVRLAERAGLGTLARIALRLYHAHLASQLYTLCRRSPQMMRAYFEGVVGYWAPTLLRPHFTPRYAPWEQRLCAAPDADFYLALRDRDRAEIVTAEIAGFSSRGLALSDGTELAADVVVLATGFDLRLLGGARVRVDGEVFEPSGSLLYRNFAPEGVPNCALVLGYFNNSFTLRVELVGRYIVRLLAAMDAAGAATCTPVAAPDERRGAEGAIPLSSGYVLRATGRGEGGVGGGGEGGGGGGYLQQGSRRPWLMSQSYFADAWEMETGRVDDGVMAFRPAGVKARWPAREEAVDSWGRLLIVASALALVAAAAASRAKS